MAQFVKLTGKTGKAKNKINEAGKPDLWVVNEIRNVIGFSDRAGPWLHIRPDNNLSEKSRWVHLNDDSDFKVEVVNKS